MLPETWLALQPHFDEALDADEPARQALLQRLQRQDPTLAQQLQDLLDQHGRAQASAFLQQEPHPGGIFGTPLVGQRLGAYSLVEAIGEGGMGSVWLARRNDGRFEGVAAVKLLALSLSSAERAERFRREGHILARLTHPHIARLLDAGVSPTGQPYLVLEHVQGRHIDAYCNDHKLGLAARLRLFVTLLGAVQHAHSHLVVHRDIKPSNVMVDDAGALKLLDFGIAKLMTAEAHTEAPLTQQAGGLLTPGYAAPEQLGSGAISTATDVYALGVLLYVLLAGKHPTLREGSSAAQAMQDTLLRDAQPMAAAVRGDEAAAAMRGQRAAALSRALAGDLDTIVAKALQRSPAARYASAAAFADDLQRHLNQQPVLARRPGPVYLLRRFVQRHRVAVAAAAVGAAVLAAVGAQSVQQSQAARMSQAQAQTVDGLMQSLFHGMSPDAAASRNFNAKELLDRGQAFLDSRADVDPATRRAARLRMAGLYRDVGAYKEAAAGFAAEAAEAAQAGQPQAQALALWLLATVRMKELDFDGAREAQTELAAVVAADAKRTPAIEGRLALLQGELALSTRRLAEALPALTRADTLLRGQADLELAARAAQALGSTARLTGDVDGARRHYERAVAMHARRGADALVDALNVRLDLGGLENSAGLHAAAVKLLTPLHADLLERLGPQHPSTIAAVSELALAELRLGQYAAMQTWLTRLRGSSNTADAWRDDHAATLQAMAWLYSGQVAAAEPELRRLLAALLRDEGGVSTATEPLRRLHGEALLRLGRVREAEATLRLAEANQLKLSRPGHSSVATTQVLLGVALAQRGDVAAARQLWAAAAPVLARTLGPRHPYAVAATSYAALAAAPEPAGSSAAHALAAQLTASLGWQEGAPALAALLRTPGAALDWRRLPVVL